MSKAVEALGNTGIQLNTVPTEQVTQQEQAAVQQAAEAMGIGAEPTTPTPVTVVKTIPEVFATLVTPHKNGITNDYNSSQVNSHNLIQRKNSLEGIKLSSNEFINHILLNMAARFGLWQRWQNVYVANMVKFLENISTGTALVEINNGVVRFTAPDTTVTELAIKHCFKDVPVITEHLRSTGTTIETDPDVVKQIAKAIGVTL